MDGATQQAGKQLVTKAEYARRMGWDRSYLSQAATIAKIQPAIETDERGRGRINVALADQIFKNTTDPAKVRKESPPEPVLGFQTGAAEEEGAYAQVRRENLELKNERERLALAEQKTLLLPKSETLAAIAGACQTIQEFLQGRNRRIAEQAATMQDAREIKVMLDADDRTLFQLMSDEFIRRLNGGGRGPTVN